ncbi:Poly(3-hydroxyalkanoate) polymerase subunit PhaC [Massilia sp. Bi118]|uniref:alpha/beta fold hydrolase n=1 Tax=Massilia sp. Bi118 TaxID=2822346 RepID=UPI001D4F9A7C|nr:alpha/beta fold hydrolase [Massilia sp. Bi118]CAH0295459.1 Poly(3-hydroxyalkanoate) polymerase subunit PhaC [Massilia sp. Bi118]
MIASKGTPFGDWGAMVLKQMDHSRQARGQMMERAGYGPRPTPSTVLHREPGLKLRRYGPRAAEGPSVLLVPAPIKRAYIWDLAPEVSVVRRWVEHGYRVYMAEWEPLGEHSQGQDFGLADYAGRLLGACRQAIGEDGAGGKPVIAGHSLGGVLAAIHSCLHPGELRATILLESPLHFQPGSCCFNGLVKVTPDARQLAERFGHVPGAFLNTMSAMAEPIAFQWERWTDRWLSLADPQALATHMQVERWTHDEFALPARLFGDIVESLYRRDQFMQGELDIGGQRIGPQSLRTPLLGVIDPRSKLIPPAAVLSFHEAAASPRKQVLHYGGDVGVNLQHVGVLVGRSAHARIWPAIFDWLDGVRD